MATPCFDWDAGNTAHIARRGITREEAESAFNDPDALFVSLRVEQGEWRAETVGRSYTGPIISVVTTPRDGLTRVVTAFDARPRSRRQYVERG